MNLIKTTKKTKKNEGIKNKLQNKNKNEGKEKQ